MASTIEMTGETLVASSFSTSTPDNVARVGVDDDVVNGPGTLLGVHIVNHAVAAAGANDAYVRIWDDLAPVFGTTDPDFVIPAPEASQVFFPVNPDNGGVSFDTGISVGATKDAGSTHSTALSGVLEVSLVVKV